MQFRWIFATAGGAAAALENFVIPSWSLLSEKQAGSSVEQISSPSYSTSSWHQIGSKATVFGGLIDAGVYNTQQLFYSQNLQDTVDYLPYYSPWLYRSQFALKPGNGSHTFLQTNGITSKADIYLNGKLVANKLTQAGAYAGHRYDITKTASDSNVILIRAYPTDYNTDFGLGWVDWNSYPPDNGTGVWRDISIKQTGPLAMGTLRVVHNYKPGASKVVVSLKANVTNMENTTVSGIFKGSIIDPQGHKMPQMSQKCSFMPMETKTVIVSTTVTNPQLWWPAQWGGQPLYSAQVTMMAQGEVSDQSESTNFGIRLITSELQGPGKDRMFNINGHPFQVRGGGYAPDVFLRWNATKFEAQAQYVLDMGMNTIRLEGKMEQPEMYDIADRMGLMVMPGWECCDKWEAWSYNDEIGPPAIWNSNDYNTAEMSMRHEAATLQTHASILTFLIGSDYWPNERAATSYINALSDFDFPNPVVCSAAQLGYVKALGPSGVKMPGPYDWVPPDYWYNGTQLGTAFGFGSELGAGVGTPEIGSLKQFLSASDLKDLWTKPNKGLYHMSTNVSQFHDRSIYNEGLYKRYGKPKSLDDYLLKAQIMDYEATRAQFEAYAARWSAKRPATGVIYWMLNNAWPSLHWNQFDYYLHPAGSYFGTKAGAKIESAVYDYYENDVYLINQSLNNTGKRTIVIELIDLQGKVLSSQTISTTTTPNASKKAMSVSGLEKIKDVGLLRLILTNEQGVTLSRSVYWLATTLDQMDWSNSTWYNTPVTSFADYTALMNMPTAAVKVTASSAAASSFTVTLQNQAKMPAFFIRLNLVDGQGKDIVPVIWSDNYVTLWPGEKMVLNVSCPSSCRGAVQVSGANFGPMTTVNVA